MLILLGVSTGLAIVAPDPREPEQSEETGSPTGATGPTGEAGNPPDTEEEPGSAPAMVEAKVGPDSKDRSVEAKGGDRLVLSVQTGEPTVVEI